MAITSLTMIVCGCDRHRDGENHVQTTDDDDADDADADDGGDADDADADDADDGDADADDADEYDDSLRLS